MRSVPSANTCTTTTPSRGAVGAFSVNGWGTSASKPVEYTGMIIKITKSTSRISIKGTTFMSETIPRLPPTNIPIIHLVFWRLRPGHRSEQTPREEDSYTQRKQVKQAPPLQTKENLLARFELGGDQTNLVNAGAAHDIDGAGDVHEHYIVVAFDKSNFLGTLLEDLLHTRAKTIPGGVFIVDLKFAVHGNLDDHGFVLELDVLLLVRRGLRNERIQALGNKRRDDHENNDQHEQNVDQRDHVGRGHRSARFSSYIHPHSESPVGLR